MSAEFVQLSKFLSLVLRHKPEEIGLTLDPNGWAGVDRRPPVPSLGQPGVAHEARAGGVHQVSAGMSWLAESDRGRGSWEGGETRRKRRDDFEGPADESI